EGDPFRVVVTDMQMPGMDGEALARAIKADPVLRDTLLIMLTSSGVRGDSKRFASLGFSAYLTKPVRMFQLHNCIAAVLGGSCLHEKEEAAIVTTHWLREASRQNARILLVEDNKVNKLVAEGILGKLGFIADTADNGQQAINMLEAASYDIVFMDVQMPVMDGYQATMAIRGGKTKAANPNVPIIAMTAHAMTGDREKCLQCGMDDYISKPISPRKLSKVLEKWLPQARVKLPAATDTTHDKTAAAVEALPVFDYEGLMERIMDDKGLAGTIVTAFMKEIPWMVDDLRVQIARGDAGLAGRQAHKIKGAASNTGCMAMSAIAADMQKAGEQGEMETLIALMPELDSQLELLKAKVKDSGLLTS
ncbi:MAG: response regulator, partial [Dissulfurispiraceae bacterium]